MLLPCHSCSRHIRETEKSCPFCGSEKHSSTIVRTVAAVGIVLAMAGCEKPSRRPEMANVYGAPPHAASKPTSTPTSNEAPKVEPEPTPRPNAPMYGLPPKR